MKNLKNPTVSKSLSYWLWQLSRLFSFKKSRRVIFERFDPKSFGGNNYEFKDIVTGEDYIVSIGWAVLNDYQTTISFKNHKPLVTFYGGQEYIFPKNAFIKIGIQIVPSGEPDCLGSGLPIRACFHCNNHPRPSDIVYRWQPLRIKLPPKEVEKVKQKKTIRRKKGSTGQKRKNK